jgi:hypothetical protein
MHGPTPQSTEQPQSPSPPPVSEVFRESFLAWFVRPEHQSALRLLGDLAGNVLCEARDYIDTPESSVWRETIFGAIRDLRQAADRLKEAARDMDEAASGGREVVRVMLAISDAFTEIEPIAARLDAALAVYLAAPEEE